MSYYRDLSIRVNNLEVALDAVLNNPKFVFEKNKSFNNQSGRRKIFESIFELLDFDRIIETGTWLGETTGHMAFNFQGPVYSSEIDSRFFSISKKKLEELKNVHLYNLDSRVFLSQLLSDASISDGLLFFYLDAHWYDDLPLLEELKIIEKFVPEFVIMIDDFEVPGDSGYKFDYYSKINQISLKYIGDFINKNQTDVFFPSLPSKLEDGLRRGCCVLTRKGKVSQTLSNSKELTFYYNGN